jgi:hypothetical protein
MLCISAISQADDAAVAMKSDNRLIVDWSPSNK